MKIKVKELREAKGMSQADLARAVNASKPLVCQWESGVRRPSLHYLPVLADVLGCSIDALFGRAPSGKGPKAGGLIYHYVTPREEEIPCRRTSGTSTRSLVRREV